MLRLLAMAPKPRNDTISTFRYSERVMATQPAVAPPMTVDEFLRTHREDDRLELVDGEEHRGIEIRSRNQ